MKILRKFIYLLILLFALNLSGHSKQGEVRKESHSNTQYYFF